MKHSHLAPQGLREVLDCGSLEACDCTKHNGTNKSFSCFLQKGNSFGGEGVEISTKFQAFLMALPQQGPHPKGPIGPLGRCVLVSLG